MLLIYIGVIVLLIHIINTKYELSDRFFELLKYLHKIFIFSIHNWKFCPKLPCIILWIQTLDNSRNSLTVFGIVSIAIVLLLVIFTLTIFIQWFKTRNRKQHDQLYYLKDYFAGIKQTNWIGCTQRFFVEKIDFSLSRNFW